MAEPSRSFSSDDATANALQEKIRTLEGRLRKGEEILRAQKEAGSDRKEVEWLETRWINLLRQYELLCDRLERHQQAQHRQMTTPHNGPEQGSSGFSPTPDSRVAVNR
jgi:hypothetical protein